MNILDKIMARKREEVAARKGSAPVETLREKPLFAKPALSAKAFLLHPQKTGIIAEYKRQSPSRGVINDRAGVEEVTRGYSEAGASVISVLTDGPFFGGALSDLEAAAAAVAVPLLRKDFVLDEYQLFEAKACGASLILLIAACLPVGRVAELAGAARELGLEVLLEIHHEEELGHIVAGVDLVGVNNRDLKTFTVSLETSARLAPGIPDEKVKISESGIYSTDDIRYLRGLGYRGFLIGENFMRSENPGKAFKSFAEAL